MKLAGRMFVCAFFATASVLPVKASIAADQWDNVLLYENALDIRCSMDSLDAGQARGRVHWSASRYPETVAQYYSYITTGTTDYQSILGDRQTAVQMAKDEWLKFPSGKDRVRPMYPLWGRGSGEKIAVWPAPTTENGPANKPDDVSIRARCTSSCYKPAVRLLYGDGYRSIKEALETRAPDIVTLAGDATLDAPRFLVGSIDRYTIEATDAHHEITVIETAGGGKLEVTGNHPLVDGEGYMREASTLEPGDSLARADGSEDEIVRVTTEHFFGKVYNVKPKSDSLKGHVVIAEGFLSGSAWYQNDGADYMNRDIFRLNLPDSIVE